VNHVEFGALVTCLREDLRWTQAELAGRAELELALVNEVEAGRRKGAMDGDTLLRLADGLLLTSMERREFMLAASGVTDREFLRPDIGSSERRFDIASFLKGLGESVAILRLPAFVTDAYCDILLANRAAIGFYNPPPSMMEEAGRMMGGFNQINYVFHRDSNFPNLVKEEELDRLALANIRHFRTRTLRFRHKSYCAALIKHFLNRRKYPYFERYWRMVAFEVEDDHSLRVGIPWAEDSNAFVETESLLALTPHGELYLHQLTPLNSASLKKMASLIKEFGAGYAEFARLPDPRKE